MNLVSKSGRLITLNEAESADYLRLTEEKGETFARGAAFGRQLPSQITFEVIAGRQRAEAEKRARQRARLLVKKQQFRDYTAVVEGLKHLCPNLGQVALNRIFRRGRRLVPGRGISWSRPAPVSLGWDRRTRKEQSAAIATVHLLLQKLNANDWRKFGIHFTRMTPMSIPTLKGIINYLNMRARGSYGNDLIQVSPVPTLPHPGWFHIEGMSPGASLRRFAPSLLSLAYIMDICRELWYGCGYETQWLCPTTTGAAHQDGCALETRSLLQ